MAEGIRSNRIFDESQRLHLQFIQDVITRMNSNSFSMKGWMIAIVSAFVALYVDKGNVWLLCAPTVPTILFWCLDAYYLQQERKYRNLYNSVVSTDSDIHLFDMDASRYDEKYWGVFWSKTIWPLYGVVIALLFALTLFLHWNFIISCCNWL